MWDGNAHLSDDEKALITAAKETGDAAEVRRLLAGGVGVDIRDGHNMPWDQTPLMLAARNGFLEIVRILLAAGASVAAVDKNASESDGEHTPLHHAVMGKNRAVVEAILDAGASLNALTTAGNPPLNMAIGDLEMMKLLLERGAAVTRVGRKRFRPPLYAVSNAKASPLQLTMVELLLRAGADPNATGDRGNTALKCLAAGHSDDEPSRLACLSALLQAGARDLPDKDGSTALHIAMLYKNTEAVRLLVEGGVPINRVERERTLLDIADDEIKNAKKDLEDATQPEWLHERVRHDLQAIEELVEYLAAHGGKRRREMSPDELAAAADGPGPASSPNAGAVKPSSAGPRAKQPPLGAKHFLKLANDGEPEWSLLAVQATREQVTDWLCQRYQSATVERGVALKAARKNDQVAHQMAIVQIKDNPWTVVLRTLYHVREDDVCAVADDARALSQQLNARAISWVAEDTSGAVQFELFERGEVVERAQWADGGAFAVFESTRRKAPKLDEVDVKFVDKTFRDLGIYLPACYPRGKSGNVCLCVEKASAGQVDSADLLEQKL